MWFFGQPEQNMDCWNWLMETEKSLITGDRYSVSVFPKHPFLRGCNGWKAVLMQWAWTWANFGRWWETERPVVQESMRSQRIEHNWETEQQQLILRLCAKTWYPRTISISQFYPFFWHWGYCILRILKISHRLPKQGFVLKQIEENTWGRLVKTESKGSGEFADVSMGVNTAKLLCFFCYLTLGSLLPSF